MTGVTAVAPANRAEQGRFKKGRSGNPSGRPVVAKGFRDRCKEFMDVEGWRTLIEMARQPARDQLPALTLIASYAYGKPTQPISGLDDAPLTIRIEYADADSSETA